MMEEGIGYIWEGVYLRTHREQMHTAFLSNLVDECLFNSLKKCLMKVQFVTDAKGRKTAVQIPIKEWERIRVKLDKDDFFDDLKEALHEAELYSASKTALTSASELLHGL